MEIRTLRAFVEVVRQGGFSRAAKTVFATQSTVSKAVKQLEDEIGVPLLDRIGHRSKLTAAGEIVYRRGPPLPPGRGALKLGLLPVGSGMLFAPLFAIYRKRYPGIDIRLVEYGSERLWELLLSGEIELASSLLPVPEGFEWKDAQREPLTVLLPAGHTLSRRRSVDLLALRELPFILFETGFALNRIILDACHRHSFEPTVVARSSQIDFIVALAATGMGAAFLPRTIAEQRKHPSVARVPFAEADMAWHVAMIWRRGAYLSHAAKAWLDLVATTRGKK